MYPKQYCDFDYASRTNGKKPAQEFYNSLPDEEKDNFRVLADKLGEEGTITNTQKFKKLQTKEDIWQFSTYNYRLLCFKLKRCWFFTNGFPKTSQATPPRYIRMAIQIKKEHLRRMKKKKGT